MSCILALKTARFVVLAADTQETNGQLKNLTDCKLFDTAFGICGFVGNSEAQYRLKDLLDRNPDPKTIVNWPTEDWGGFYFTFDGQSYELDSPGIVGFFDNLKIMACGSGMQYALGAVTGFLAGKRIHHLENCSLKSLQQAAHIGVSAAIHYDLQCGGRVDFRTLSF